MSRVAEAGIANDHCTGRSENSSRAPLACAGSEDDPIHRLIGICREARADERTVLAETSKAEARMLSMPPGTHLRKVAMSGVSEWEEAEAAALDRTDRALRELVTSERPTTFAGAVALLRFAVGEDVAESIPESVEVVRDGQEWVFSWHELAIECALPIIEAALRDRETIAP